VGPKRADLKDPKWGPLKVDRKWADKEDRKWADLKEDRKWADLKEGPKWADLKGTKWAHPKEGTKWEARNVVADRSNKSILYDQQVLSTLTARVKSSSECNAEHRPSATVKY